MRKINRLKRQMSGEFEMKDMGAVKQIHGMSIIRDRAEGQIFLIKWELLAYLCLIQEESIKKQSGGCCTTYLKGTSKVALCFSKKDVILEGFSDVYLGGCLDTRKSTVGYIFILGGTSISWMSLLQRVLLFQPQKHNIWISLKLAGR
ncbi:uncharacterized protein LOC141673757 [Apium graveolens]|uniref:uncharacterized protein LOC141673757 n=1 Tax=Apium graveolens TaxID=4045 RepID=UPI003D799236